MAAAHQGPIGTMISTMMIGIKIAMATIMIAAADDRRAGVDDGDEEPPLRAEAHHRHAACK
jgi:hypothetical protein